MSWMTRIRTLFGGAPVHEAAGRGRRALAWMPGNPGAVTAMLATSNELRVKSRDLVRRNAWANAGIEAFVANAVGTGIKPQSMAQDEPFRVAVQALWRDWTEEADATGQTDFYGLQALACRATDGRRPGVENPCARPAAPAPRRPGRTRLVAVPTGAADGARVLAGAPGDDTCRADRLGTRHGLERRAAARLARGGAGGSGVGRRGR